MSWLEQYEGVVRMSVFVGVLISMGILEALLPRKRRTQPRAQRWTTNAVIVVLDTLLLRVAFPVLAVGLAAQLYDQQGLLSLVAWPFWVETLVTAVVFDFLIWGQHVISHRVPLLWRFHKMHHVDRDIDVTTALRFHPVEIGLSMAYKVAWIFILGPTALGIFLFEVLLNGTAMFNHANVRLPIWLDRTLRWVLVTPDVHRVHHSVDEAETNSNYGFCLSIWDRLFRTYQAQPIGGHDGMTIGLADHQDDRPSQLLWSLWLPFIGKRR